MIEKLNFSIRVIGVAVAGFFVSGLCICAANAQSESNDENREFWLWLEAYADDRGNIMDPIDLSELASASQNQQAYPADDSYNTRIKKPISKKELANDLTSEINPQPIDAYAGNDEVHAQ